MDELFYLFVDQKKKVVNYKHFIDWILNDSLDTPARSYEDSLDNRSSISEKSIIIDQRNNIKKVE